MAMTYKTYYAVLHPRASGRGEFILYTGSGRAIFQEKRDAVELSRAYKASRIAKVIVTEIKPATRQPRTRRATAKDGGR